MDKLIIEGGNKLNGTIKISGSKNAVLPVITATLILPGEYRITNVPDLKDTRTMIQLLEIIGAKITKGKNTLNINTVECNNPIAPYDLVKTMRASFYVLGPLLSRFHYSEVSLPGGCAWGPRPVDFHIKALREMKVNISLDRGNIIAKGQPIGNKIVFKKKSVGATGNVIMAAARAKGSTKIINAAKEPEIVALGDFVSQLGADIHGLGTDNIIINPIDVGKCSIDFEIIPDRIEAGTFLIAVAATGGKVKINNVVTDHLKILIDYLEKIGVSVQKKENSIIIESSGKYNSKNIDTFEYPDFPTDLQAQWMSLMITANGESKITENIYSDRFTHIPELVRMGADISLNSNIATIRGIKQLYSAPVMCTDIRASAALIISALCAKGSTEVSRIYHIDRGYERIEEKLTNLGANIKRISI